MALRTVKLLRTSLHTVLLGAAFALSAVTLSPVLAASRHTLHHAGHEATALHHTEYHHAHHRLAHAGVTRLSSNHFSGTHFSGTHLSRTHFSGAHFSNAQFSNAGLDYGSDLYVTTRHGHHRYLHHTRYGMRYTHENLRFARYTHSGLQCVPYAREISHIALSGNAFLWWAEASGRYARGNAPEQGAVLNFRAIGRMPLGHVAVVTAVLDERTILVTQANWVRGSITNDVTVQDVSPANDWTQVKVELGDTTTSGAPYPTYGFIYNRPDSGTIIANSGQGTEVAEAPAVTQVSDDAPNRNLQ